MKDTTPSRHARALWGSGPAAAAVLLVCTLTQCVCQNSRGEEPPTTAPAQPANAAPAKPADPPPAKAAKGPELPAALDVRDLDADEKAVLAAVLTEQFDPCGEPRSFADSLRADDTCDKAREMGSFTVGLVQRGLSKRQITRELLKELSRTSVEADFDLEGSPVLGDPAAKHVIVEFLDFECPFCKLTSEPVKALAKQHGATLVIKHLPLDGHHEHAREAALASLAAHRQGKYWAYAKLLFDNQSVLSSERIVALAGDAGLDLQRFEADRKGDAVAATLARDVAEADRLQLDGTPYFFLDGHVVAFEQLEEALKKATGGP